MAKLSIAAGSTGVMLDMFIQASTATDGSGLSGLKHNSASLTCYYHRSNSGTATPMTLATATVGTWVSEGFIEIDATNMPGFYQLHVPNAMLASGARSATVMLKGATAMAQLPLEVELTVWDNQISTATTILAGVVHTGAIIPQVQTASVALVANAVGTATSVGSVTNVLGTATTILAGAVHTGAIIPQVQTASVTLTANAVGTASNVGSVTSVLGTATVILAGVTHTGATVPTVSVVTTSADGRMANLDAAVSSRGTGNANAGDAMALTAGERLTLAGVIGTASQAESYRTNGEGGSISQMLYEAIGHLGESAIAGTGKVVKKIDHATTAMTFNLDDSTAPTSITRGS